MVKILEGTFDDWKQWFTENRSKDPNTSSAIPRTLSNSQTLIRLWTITEGKPPEEAHLYRGNIWEQKRQKPSPNLVIIHAKGSIPLVLTLPEFIPFVEFKQIKSSKGKRVLKSPFRWRCRKCLEEGFADEIILHCGIRTRQLAPISEESRDWFTDFTARSEWRFVHPNDLHVMPSEIREQDKINLACTIGIELQDKLNSSITETPDWFELYDERSSTLKVSNLKLGKKKFIGKIESILSWQDKIPSPKVDAPKAEVEIGHVFDEYLTQVFRKIPTTKWKAMERVVFECAPLGISVNGTPDLFYEEVPIESKTVRILPKHRDMNNKALKKFKDKWQTNYLPQIAMYSKGINLEWMFLLLISRQNKEFSIIPVSGKIKLQKLEDKWTTWMSDDEFVKKLNHFKRKCFQSP